MVQGDTRRTAAGGLSRSSVSWEQHGWVSAAMQITSEASAQTEHSARVCVVAHHSSGGSDLSPTIVVSVVEVVTRRHQFSVSAVQGFCFSATGVVSNKTVLLSGNRECSRSGSYETVLLAGSLGVASAFFLFHLDYDLFFSLDF